jgi:hypothetical protein
VAGQTTAGVVALMVMHVVTAVIAVTAYRKTMPVPDRDTRRGQDS